MLIIYYSRKGFVYNLSSSGALAGITLISRGPGCRRRRFSSLSICLCMESLMIREYAIRKANRNDLPRIAEIQVFNYRLFFYPIFKSDAYFFNRLRVSSLMQEYESAPDSLYVYDDGAVKGFIKIEGTYIARLFVEPVLQNASIGSRLLEYAVKEHNADHLWVLEKNTKAIRFYEKHGFTVTGEKKPEDGTSEYLVLMKKG